MFKFFVNTFLVVYFSTAMSKIDDFRLPQKPTQQLKENFPTAYCSVEMHGNHALLNRCMFELELFRSEYLEGYNMDLKQYAIDLKVLNDKYLKYYQNNNIGPQRWEKIRVQIENANVSATQKNGKLYKIYIEYKNKMLTTARAIESEKKRSKANKTIGSK